jgi:AraC-like DNA-binding protein
MDCDDIELDLPPEYCHYQDNGCEFADSCLDCPFPECVYDEPGGRQRWLKELRDEAVLRLFTAQSKKVKDLARMFGVSRRTIQRILKQAKDISIPKIKTLRGADG